jgi:hypothetical protein
MPGNLTNSLKLPNNKCCDYVFLSYQKRNGFFDVFVTIRDKMTVVDEKQHENEDHDPRHESERR